MDDKLEILIVNNFNYEDGGYKIIISALENFPVFRYGYLALYLTSFP